MHNAHSLYYCKFLENARIVKTSLISESTGAGEVSVRNLIHFTHFTTSKMYEKPVCFVALAVFILSVIILGIWRSPQIASVDMDKCPNAPQTDSVWARIWGGECQAQEDCIQHLSWCSPRGNITLDFHVFVHFEMLSVNKCLPTSALLIPVNLIAASIICIFLILLLIEWGFQDYSHQRFRIPYLLNVNVDSKSF